MSIYHIKILFVSALIVPIVASAAPKVNTSGLVVETAERIAADSDLQQQLNSIQLTPGPVGPEGPAGAVGLTGPVGPEGLAGADGTVGPDIPARDAICKLYHYQGLSMIMPDFCGVLDKIVFVTSRSYTGGELQGIVGADLRCQTAADSANLPGIYLAWIATGTGNDAPETRFTKLLDNTANYVNTLGEIVATDWSDLTDGSLGTPINVTEYGLSKEGIQGAWTNVQENGTVNSSMDDCAGWGSDESGSVTLFGNTGSINFQDSTWTESGMPAECYLNRMSLYCFEQ